MVTHIDFAKLVPASLLQRLALRYKVDACNTVALPGAAVFICLLNGVMNYNELTLRLLEETYQEQTGRKADHSSFGKRLARLPVGYFASIFDHVRTRVKDLAPGDKTPSTAVLRLRRVDATIVTLSSKLLHFGIKTSHGTSCGKAENRVVRARNQVKAVFELDDDGIPGLLHVCRDQAEASDNVAMGDTMVAHATPGDLFVFDKGCHSRDRLLALHTACAYFLTPHHQQSLKTLRTLYGANPADRPTGAPREGEADYILSRVEEAIFENGKKEKRFQALPLVVLHGFRFDTRNIVWREMTLITNLPVSKDGDGAGPFTFSELASVYRSRWDIEIFFRLIKSRLGYRHLTSRTENGIRIIIYTVLIAALLLIWYKRAENIIGGWRVAQARLAERLRYWTADTLVQAFQGHSLFIIS